MINLSKQVYPVIIFSVYWLVACTQNKENDLEVQLYLSVEGTCLENHVLAEHQMSYKGGIIKWVYPGKLPPGEKGIQWRGYLTRPIDYSPSSLTEIIDGLYKYKPPTDIHLQVDHFENSLPPEVTSGIPFTLHGLGMREREELTGKKQQALEFETTCQLQVIKQFDHYPTSEERTLL
ncbi:MAG: hypothetical protein KC643_31805 [Nitrospira sp.]|nr:hypothetical protein [Nitrospira sp.]